jgi:hypothetical protein
MSIYNVPRCQHLKVNGTQCGSPALKRNRFCFFHKRFQEEQIKLNGDRLRRGRANFYLPVLEDANSIQVSLMQIMRLLASGQIDSKIAGLLLYALQTASFNLRHLSFEPCHKQDIVIDRGTIDQTYLDCDQWSVDDFPDPEPTRAEKAAAAAEEAAKAQAAAKEKARRNAALEAQRAAAARALPTPPAPAVPTPPAKPWYDDPEYGEPAPGPAPQASQSPAPRAPASAPPQPAFNPKQSAPTQVKLPATPAKLNHKKAPRKADMNEVREKIRGKVRDWVMSTAKEPNSQRQRV